MTLQGHTDRHDSQAEKNYTDARIDPNMNVLRLLITMIGSPAAYTGVERLRISVKTLNILKSNLKLSDRLPFLFGKACYVFRSENALYSTGHIIGRMMIMKTALLLNTL